MHIVTLSGWGQPYDALQEIVPMARPIDYARHDNVNAALFDIGHQASGADLAIGWSLGGQMLVRAIAADLIRVKKLILIATPFQFVQRVESKLGMPTDLFATFYDNYVQDASRTLEKAWFSVAKGDAKAASVQQSMNKQDKEKVMSYNWLAWLDTLKWFSCLDTNLTAFPPTLLIHGRQDAVVHHNQSRAFMHTLPDAKLITVEHCGHAPHWHDWRMMQRLIAELIHA